MSKKKAVTNLELKGIDSEGNEITENIEMDNPVNKLMPEQLIKVELKEKSQKACEDAAVEINSMRDENGSLNIKATSLVVDPQHARKMSVQ